MTLAEREEVEAVVFGLLLRGNRPTYEFITWLNEQGREGEDRHDCWIVYYDMCNHFPGGATDDQSRTREAGTVFS